MKAWAFTLILLAMFGLVAKALLPKENGSLSFLLALCTVFTLFSPLTHLSADSLDLSPLTDWIKQETENVPSGEALILDRLSLEMEQDLREAFPQGGFTLEIHTSDDMIPSNVQVIGSDQKLMNDVADYIWLHYGLEASVGKQGG